MQMGFLVIKGRFALTIAIHESTIQYCDPFTLQPFSSFKIPCYTIDKYLFNNNLLMSFSRCHFLIIELDYEAKTEEEAIFG